MIRSGRVSITFRKLSPREIVDLVAETGLDGIEWGGDVHVPPGDRRRAGEVRRMTESAGLAVAAYGSYYRVGHDEPSAFDEVLATAVELRAPTVRVWAGSTASQDADARCRDLVVRESRRVADAAAQEGIVVAYEWHGGTLTDTNESGKRLLDAVAHDNVRCCWQPQGPDAETCLAGLDAIGRRLANVHVYHWEDDRRLALAEGEGRWRRYLAKIAAVGGDRFAMIEFVHADEPEALRGDAAALKRWLAEL